MPGALKKCSVSNENGYVDQTRCEEKENDDPIGN